MKHDYFGDRCMLAANFRTATAVAQGRVTCWTINKNDFTEISNQTMKSAIQKRIEMQDETVRLQDLRVVKLLGKGMFSKVYLVNVPNTDTFYGLKVVSRKTIDKYAIYEQLLLER
jgi:CRP-like cAMP-binding protein